MSLLTTVLAFAVTIGVLITFHEAGHFFAAKLCGVKVLRFSIGFGKPIFLWKSKKNPEATEWAISALPLGGYVRMLDERDPSCQPIKKEDEGKTFGSKSVFQRFFIVFAGPASNLILAVLLYATVFMIGTIQPLPVVAEPHPGTPAAEAGLHAGDRILKVDDEPVKTFSDMRYEIFDRAGSEVRLEIESPNGAIETKLLDLKKMNMDPSGKEEDPFVQTGITLDIGKPKISGFIEGSAGQKAGLHVGDKLLTVNSIPVQLPKDFVSEIRKNPNVPVELGIERKGEKMSLMVIPSEQTEADGSKVGRIGASIGVDFPKTQISYGPLASLSEGVKKTWETAYLSVKMIGKMILGEVSLKNISGPVTIADYAGQTAQLGFIPFISFLALISISLGVLNLLPIPMLDGGHLMYYSFEMIRGKPVSESFQLVTQKLGIAVLCGLTLLALFNDISRLLP